MFLIEKTVLILAESAKGNPIVATIVVYIFYLMFTLLEAIVETLIFGDRFEHWLDPIFIGCFMAYSAYAVYGCALYNSNGAP